jgi:hypothetical protein
LAEIAVKIDDFFEVFLERSEKMAAKLPDFRPGPCRVTEKSGRFLAPGVLACDK